MTIHIEISNSGHQKQKPWRIRIGDCDASTECSNISKEEVIEEVLDAMAEVVDKTGSQGVKNG